MGLTSCEIELVIVESLLAREVLIGALIRSKKGKVERRDPTFFRMVRIQ